MDAARQTLASVSPSQPLPPAAIARLRAALAGRVVTPADAGYDRARSVWNGMIDRHPALIASCASAGNVAAAIAFARQHGLSIATRGGGHSVAGFSTCDGGIVIDLSPMKRIEVDPGERIAHAGGGVTWGELDAATQAFALATPGGVFSRTGIAGLTLGGGYGWLRATYGLSCDNLIAADVVTADGRVVVAGDQEGQDAELLWGLRGGGGNFGVVTRFTFRLHPVGPNVYFAVVFHDGEGDATARVLRFFRDFCAAAPDSINPIAVCGIVPEGMEAFPEATWGKRYVMLGALFVGPTDEGERALRPLRTFAEPLADFSDVVPYVDAQQLWDADYPDGMRYYWKSLNLTRLDDAVIDRIAMRAQRQPSPLSTTDLWFGGGAVRLAPAGGSAVRGRDAVVMLGLEGNWTDAADDAANIGWAREFIAAMGPYSDGSRYLNFAGFHEDGDAALRATFGANYARLVDLKRRYDPTNLFRLNQNIDPSTVDGHPPAHPSPAMATTIRA